MSLNFPLSRTEIAGHSIASLAEQFATPTFFYDASMIRRRLSDLASFDVVRYAQKACSNLAVVDLIRRGGGLVDSVSAFEIRRALAAGYKPEGIVYTADIFDAESLRLVVEHNIHVNCGSPDMIDQYGKVAAGSEITLRLNPGFGHGHSQKTNTGGDQSKHGIWYEQLPEMIQRAAKYDLTISGVHMHIGSGVDMDHLAKVCGAMEEAAIVVGPSVRTISAGGGVPTPYTEEDERADITTYFELWDATRNRLQDIFGHSLTLEIEPGRYLAAESGFLLSEIRAIKTQGENRFYLLDAGFCNLARPILYGSYHPMSIVPSDGDFDRPCSEVIVGGPLCESGDIFTQQEGGFVSKRLLPEAQVGEYLVIECAGAYGSVMGSNYNSKPMAAEVLLNGDRADLIRSRQTFEQLIQNEHIPG
jgi:diaminopimelate decarboxylase